MQLNSAQMKQLESLSGESNYVVIDISEYSIVLMLKSTNEEIIMNTVERLQDEKQYLGLPDNIIDHIIQIKTDFDM
jgi:predicted NBD/HSP70 family sugar kinase